jgi:aspartyl-tRNA synthetase
MQKFIKTAFLMVFILLLFSTKVSAKTETGINDLIENAKRVDGKEVVVCGEVIGERMDRGENAWINLSDKTNAIGIWLNNRDADKILNYGNYKKQGDIVSVKGVFHNACKEHGGEADLHCISIEIMKEGKTVNRQLSAAKIIGAAIAVSAALLMIAVSRKKLNDMLH